MKTHQDITRGDLDANPEAAYTQVAEWIQMHQDATAHLTTVRDQVAREIAGRDRGGVARLARAAGVTNTQAGRLLVDGLVRASRRALLDAGWNRDEFAIQAGGQAHPAHVLLAIRFDQEEEQQDPEPELDSPDAGGATPPGWIERMNAAGALLDALRVKGLAAAHDGLGMDVGDAGPRHALADGKAVEVFWS